VRSNGGKDSGRVPSVLCLCLGLDTRDIRSRLDSLSVCTPSRGHVFGRSDRLGDGLGVLDLDSFGNTRKSSLGRFRSMSMSVTKAKGSLGDGFGQW
jgi:hypothetical protein